MRLVHLSDLHFGTETKDIAGHLLAGVQSLRPDRVVISGDFTQIANRKEFIAARNFIDAIGIPLFCVPGNHDISRYNVLERFIDPYAKYREFITPDLAPLYENDKIIMAGFNTARRALPHWNWANGAFSAAQCARVHEIFSGEKNKYRVCVMHHPLQKAKNSPLDVTVFGSHAAMQAIHETYIDLILTGHVHFASITVVNNTVFAGASTAMSSRLRHQENGFNVIDFQDDFFEITHYVYRSGAFSVLETWKHERNR
jgi:3',5'-cyclic AMP phosphodiesterase CpdA